MSTNNSTGKSFFSRVKIDDTTLLLTSILCIAICILLALTSVYGIVMAILNPTALVPSQGNSGKPGIPNTGNYPFKQDITIKLPEYPTNSASINNEDINSEYAALLNVSTGEIVASRKSLERISPASLTKIMTLIIVYENLPNEECLNEILTIQSSAKGHSGYGLKVGEKLTVQELIYDAILRSDGIACITLAEYIAGSEAKFVEMMNDKVRELGLLDDEIKDGVDRDKSNPSTRFMNCTGISEPLHCSTAYDLAVITAYAMQNPHCANVLTTLKYQPSSEHFRPGETNTFWHMLLHDPDKLNDGKVKSKNAIFEGGKTGWTGSDSGCCLSLVAKGKTSGDQYILITAKAASWSGAMDDIIYIFDTYSN